MNDLLPFPKAAGAIQVSNNLSVLSRKFFNVLLAVALPQLSYRREFVISITSLKLALRLETNNYSHIEAAMLALMTQPVQWSIVEPDSKKPVILTTTLMAQSIKEGDEFRFAFADGLAERLLDPELFGMININLVASISTKTALALYENAAVYDGWSPWIALDDFYTLMGARDSMSWSDLVNRNLKPAIEEVRKHTGIQIEYQVDKKGRGGKVVAVRLRRVLDDKPQPGQLELLTDSVDERLIETLMIEFEFTRKEAFDVVVGYDNDRVREVLNGLRAALKRGKPISRKVGWVHSALKNLWVFGDRPPAAGQDSEASEPDAVIINRFKCLPQAVQSGMIESFLQHPDRAEFLGKTRQSLMLSKRFRRLFAEMLRKKGV